MEVRHRAKKEIQEKTPNFILTEQTPRNIRSFWRPFCLQNVFWIHPCRSMSMATAFSFWIHYLCRGQGQLSTAQIRWHDSWPRVDAASQHSCNEMQTLPPGPQSPPWSDPARLPCFISCHSFPTPAIPPGQTPPSLGDVLSVLWTLLLAVPSARTLPIDQRVLGVGGNLSSLRAILTSLLQKSHQDPKGHFLSHSIHTVLFLCFHGHCDSLKSLCLLPRLFTVCLLFILLIISIYLFLLPIAGT